MIYLTDVISKSVVSLSEGKILGTVENAVFNNKPDKLTHLAVFDENLEDRLIYIPVNHIINASNNAVIVKSFNYAENINISENSPLRSFIYLHDGTAAGIVEDIVLNEKFEIVHLRDNNNNFINIKNIISFSNNVLVVCYDNELTQKLKKIKPAKKSGQKKQIITETAERSTNKPQENKDIDILPQTDSSGIPAYFRKIVPPFNYLIGRKTTAIIYDKNKELISDINSVITANVVDRCRRTGNLMALARNSKNIRY